MFKISLAKCSFSGLIIQSSVILSWVIIFVVNISDRYPDIAYLSRAAFSFFTTLSISGVYFTEKTDMHLYCIYGWSFGSPIITISLLFASKSWFLIAVCLLGWLYGGFLLGFLMSFGELTMIEKRGRIGGSIGFASILAMLSLAAVSLILGFIGSVVLCSLLGMCTSFFSPSATTHISRLKLEKTFSVKLDYYAKREFLLYLMPWIIYNLVNAILGRYETTSLTDRLHIPIATSIILLNFTSCIGALIGGFVADIYGRKKALGIGLTSYGISSAFSGLIFSGMQDILLTFLSFALNALSWGIFIVLYFFVVWQDLSDMSNNVFYYIGFVPYPLTMALAQFSPPNIQFPLVNLALVKCVLIFSSNLFLVAAQELLSPELRKEIDILVYLEQVKEFFKKHYG